MIVVSGIVIFLMGSFPLLMLAPFLNILWWCIVDPQNQIDNDIKYSNKRILTIFVSLWVILLLIIASTCTVKIHENGHTVRIIREDISSNIVSTNVLEKSKEPLKVLEEKEDSNIEYYVYFFILIMFYSYVYNKDNKKDLSLNIGDDNKKEKE